MGKPASKQKHKESKKRDIMKIQTKTLISIVNLKKFIQLTKAIKKIVQYKNLWKNYLLLSWTCALSRMNMSMAAQTMVEKTEKIIITVYQTKSVVLT